MKSSFGKKILRVCITLFGITLLAGILGAFWIFNEYQSFLKTSLQLPEAGIVYQVKPGTSFKPLARDLQRRGMISEANYLILLARLDKSSNKIRAGEYELAGKILPREFLQLLVSGKVLQHSLTIVEGWNFKQVMEAVNNHETFVHTLQGLSNAEIMAKVGHPDQHPEGRFFADTYYFPRSTLDVEFLIRAYEMTQRRLATAWAQREKGLPIKTPYEALILASIVEKETGLAAERPEIAGVFTRRLRKKMLLQTDPTVIYGMGEQYDGNIRRRDLRKDTPYNTYTRGGLPPTPIAMPGGAAIEAVMHPAKGKTLYFVARGDGSHYFSKTLIEHNEAVARYQLRRRRK